MFVHSCSITSIMSERDRSEYSLPVSLVASRAWLCAFVPLNADVQQKKGGEMLFLFGPFHSFLFFLLPHPSLPTASCDHVTLFATSSSTSASHTHTFWLFYLPSIGKIANTLALLLRSCLPSSTTLQRFSGFATHQSTQDIFHIVLHRCNNLTELLGTVSSFCIAHFQAAFL